jgi:hypothetical protein
MHMWYNILFENVYEYVLSTHNLGNVVKNWTQKILMVLLIRINNTPFLL